MHKEFFEMTRTLFDGADTDEKLASSFLTGSQQIAQIIREDKDNIPNQFAIVVGLYVNLVRFYFEATTYMDPPTHIPHVVAARIMQQIDELEQGYNKAYEQITRESAND